MDTVSAGQPLKGLVKLLYHADRPILIVGPHGVGKSEILEQCARELDLQFISRDLSLMEPPDLVGLPYCNGRQTVYAPPAFLPQGGRGLLVFEELNRCERYLQAPCLQLLTSRCLNDYRLPPGWLPVAAINPSEEEYSVNPLDPALLSRFVQVQVQPDRQEWLEWARQEDLHASVIRYVEDDESVFDSRESNPRAWAYVSTLLKTSQQTRSSSQALRAAVMGLVGDTRGTAFLRTLTQTLKPLSAQEILNSYTKRTQDVQAWLQQGRVDLLETSLQFLLKCLQPQAEYEATLEDPHQWANLTHFLRDLPGDLRELARHFFLERNYMFPGNRHREGIKL